MIKPTKLVVAKTEYIEFRRSQGKPYNTWRSDAACLNRLIRVAGNILVGSLTEAHIRKFFLELVEEERGQRTIDLRLTQLRQFFEWCKHVNYMRKTVDLLFDRKAKSHNDEEDDPDLTPEMWIPPHRFPELLDVGGSRHRRDRMAVATALYTLLRGVDMVRLTVDQPDLDSGRLRFYNQKSRKWQYIPISAEYAQELREYLTWLFATFGTPPKGVTWYLLPQLCDRPRDARGRLLDVATSELALNPSQPLTTAGLRAILKAVLIEIGIDVKGKASHVYRKSGAQALYYAFKARVGGAEAERLVQTMLGHRYLKTTLQYIGISQRREALNDVLNGQVMYPAAQAAANVTDIREARR